MLNIPCMTVGRCNRIKLGLSEEIWKDNWISVRVGHISLTNSFNNKEGDIWNILCSMNVSFYHFFEHRRIGSLVET